MFRKRTRSKNKLKDEQRRFLFALKENIAKVSLASYETGISRQSHYNWLKENSYYKEEFERIKNEEENEFNVNFSKAICENLTTGNKELAYDVGRLWGEDVLNRILGGEELILNVIDR